MKRIRNLVRYQLDTSKFSILVFLAAYTAGNFVAALGVSGALVRAGEFTDETTFSNPAIIGFAVFMLVYGLVLSQRETKFLITRSVARKEVFAANLLSSLFLAVILTVLQAFYMAVLNGIQSIFSGNFTLVSRDIMAMSAPDASQIGTFFVLCVATTLLCGAIGTLIGTFLTRFRWQTIAFFILLGIAFIACVMLPSFMENLVRVLKFLFTDETTAWKIIGKQLAVSLGLYAISFPVMRRISAVKTK